MKRYLYSLLVIILSFVTCGCSQMTEIKENWDCIVVCAEKSEDDSYIITYSDENIVSTTGMLAIQNRNEFAIVVHLLTNGQQEQSVEIPAGGSSVLYKIIKDENYTVGFHADVEEGVEIKCSIYDGDNTEIY